MSNRSVDLGTIEPSGSRQLGRRSDVCLVGERAVVGCADGTLVAFDGELGEVWRTDGGAGSVVSLTAFGDGVLAGRRGPNGAVTLRDAETGAVRWRHDTADDVGDPQRETRFYLPFVVAAVTDGERAYVASRRYERGPSDERAFVGVVYAFTASGEIAWRYRTDASPISLDVRRTRSGPRVDRDARRSGDASDGVVAVGFNRCPGDHRDGLVALDALSGAVCRRWDPPGTGERRVGDVALTATGVAVASHADYRGYALDASETGDEYVSRWSVDLARPVERHGDTVYAYPNHVHATAAGAVFVTGNSYPEAGRETEARHPNEHTVTGVEPGGERRWTVSVGGFSHAVATDGDRIAVPIAQHFRDRDPDAHSVYVFDVADGVRAERSASGIATAAALGGVRLDDGGAPAGELATENALAVIEEPVEYHDGDEILGSYRLSRSAVR